MGLSQAAVAEHCKVSQQAVEQMEADQVQRPRYLAELAEILETNVKWLKEGAGTPPQPVRTRPTGMYEAQWLGKNLATKIPVWGVVDAQDGDKYALNTEDTPIDYIEPLPQQNMDREAYGVLVAGESMFPALKPGYIACVNTRKPVIRGGLCVVEIKDDGAIIKEFVKREKGKVTLRQYNPDKEIEMSEKEIGRILPVVGIVIRG